MNSKQSLSSDNGAELAPITFRNFEGGVLDLSQQSEHLTITPPPLSKLDANLMATLYCAGKNSEGKEVILTLRKTSIVTAETTTDYELPLSFLKNLAHNSELKIILRIDADCDNKLRPLNSSVTRIRIKSTSEKSSQVAETKADYKRWMTDILPDIANLTLKEIAWPGTHNAGVDMESTEFHDELWGACQDDTIWWQIERGARVFDLRVKDVRRLGYPDVFWFYHSSITGMRDVRDCVSEVKSFLENNPDEIVILAIHEMSTFEDEIFRTEDFVSELSPLFDKLIPPSASNLTIAQIREQHPGKNIIIAGDVSNSFPNIGFWPKIPHSWIGQDIISEEELKDFIDKVMKDPPKDKLWSLSAAAYSWWTGPIRLSADDESMKAPFVEGAKPSIVNVDFFHDVGVVDRCIEYNKKLGNSRKK